MPIQKFFLKSKLLKKERGNEKMDPFQQRGILNSLNRKEEGVHGIISKKQTSSIWGHLGNSKGNIYKNVLVTFKEKNFYWTRWLNKLILSVSVASNR